MTPRVLDETAADVIARLPRIGKLMIITSHNDITHERIGILETITPDGDWLHCAGAEHDSRIHLPSIARMTVDTSSVAEGTAYPRIDFRDGENAVIFGVIGFTGLAPFEAAIEGLALSDSTGGDEAAPFQPAPDAAENDPAYGPMNGAAASGQPITVTIERAGFSQNWHGTVEKIVTSHGFINIIVPDFHFHVRGGAVSSWANEGGSWTALSADGIPIGLSLHGASAAAFEPAAA
jgi:putative heme degradation protein